MPLFTDALIGDTTHLTTEEFGAYCLILFVTWRNNGQPLPDDDARLARVCRVTVRRWRKMRPTLAEFFSLSDGNWRQKRLEKEWAYVADLRDKQSKKGKQSAEAKLLRNKDTASTVVDQRLEPDVNRTSTDLLTGCQPEANPHTHTHTREERKKDKTADGGTGYAFEGRIIRLTEAHLNTWRKSFHAIIDILAELTTLDDYYFTQLPEKERSNWFIRASAALGKKHQAALALAKSKHTGGFVPLGVGG